MSDHRPKLEVRVPPGHDDERRYAARVVLGSFLGYEPDVRAAGGDQVEIRVAGEDGLLALPDGLFATPAADWLRPRSLPREPLAWRRLDGKLAGAATVDLHLPVVFANGAGRPLLEGDASTGGAVLHLDVLGAAFFWLTRYEERAAAHHEDVHGRFPATAALAHRAGFLDRPIVDEYVEVLRTAMQAVWPRLPVFRRRADVWLTHDVDWPLVTLRRDPREVLRSALADVVARRSPGLARRRLVAWRRGRRGDFSADPGDTFDALMSIAEQAGLRATFTLLAGGDAPLDGRYRLADPWIRRLVGRIAARGHELGFHASYRSYDDAEGIAREFAAVRDAAESAGVEQQAWRGRQHFLRWRSPVTWRAWSDAGLAVDSSVYFAEAPGFRTGTCHAYPVFDLERRRELPLVELPLTLMDVSASRYGGLDDERTLDLAETLAGRCRRVGGTMVLLWHNDAVMTPRSLRLYRDVVDAAVGSSA